MPGSLCVCLSVCPGPSPRVSKGLGSRVSAFQGFGFGVSDSRFNICRVQGYLNPPKHPTFLGSLFIYKSLHPFAGSSKKTQAQTLDPKP